MPDAAGMIAKASRATESLPARPCRHSLLLNLGDLMRRWDFGVLSRRVLAIGAHPDDIMLGAGGYLLQLRDWGHEITLLTLSSGALAGDGATREAEEVAAARLCDFNVELARLNDGSIDFSASLECIEAAVEKVAPDLVITHSQFDTHQDHETVARATAAACRGVSSLYAYEGPSCTNFVPTMIIDCSNTWDRKIAALDCYASQMSRKPYMTWVKVVSAFRAWPRYNGLPCEAFAAVRHDPHTYPGAAMRLFSDVMAEGAGPKRSVYNESQ